MRKLILQMQLSADGFVAGPKGELADEISTLKQKKSKDIIVYGGGKFVSSLIEAGLVDEFQFFVNPTAIGNGIRILPVKQICNCSHPKHSIAALC